MPLGAIVKAGAKSLAKQQGKKIVADKLMGRKSKALPAAGQTGASKKDTAMNMVSSMASKSPMQGPEIPASKQTINVSAQTVGSDVGSGGGGSAIVKQVQDISVVVATIADSMKGNLVLKEKAQSKARKAAERDKRAAQESETEKPDQPQKPDGGDQKFKVPKIGFLSGIFGFLTKFIFGIAILKLIELADSPIVKGIIGALKFAGNVITKFLFPVAGGFLDGLISFVDLAYTITDGAEKIVKNIFGEEGAEKFRTFMENFKTLINSFIIFKILKTKVFDAIVRNIKNAFKIAKNIIKNAGKVISKVFPNLAKGAGKIFQAGKGLLSKGASKVGGFAAKIFGKAAGVISPAFKGAKPFLSKFFGKIPIVGPLVITIVSLLSGEPASQAIFKGLGAALGGALGTFIPIPILGTLIGETIGVFVGDLLYELLMGGGIEAVGQKLKDTFTTIFKGGKAVANWLGGGIKSFINNVLMTDPINVPEGGGVRSLLTRGTKSLGLYGFLEGLGFAGGKDGQIDKFINPLNLLNPLKFYPLLFKSFFGKRDESESGAADGGGGTEAVVSGNQDNTNGKNADAVAAETTYESGEGDVVFVPLKSEGGDQFMSNVKSRTYSTKSIKRNIDEVTLSMYAGK